MATDTNSVDYDDVSYVIKSEYKVAVLLALDEGMSTPSNIAAETDIGIAHVSRGLSQLRDRGLVDLVVDEDTKKGRIYSLRDDVTEDFVDAVREVTGE